ncbi:MAG TPA: HisA/HisF-related TIM barrel protein, partial [Spirochaetia bacterium]|nr:HisA/HisF-related TIM barrel protein [Spirochaetia bacterium]
ARSPGQPCGYEVVIDGGRTRTGMDALTWARKAESLGAGEIVLNSIDADGTKDGYDLAATGLISTSVGIPVVASGGAGRPEHLVAVLKEAGADAALIASMVHYGEWTVGAIKRHLAGAGIPVRMTD